MWLDNDMTNNVTERERLVEQLLDRAKHWASRPNPDAEGATFALKQAVHRLEEYDLKKSSPRG
jgi:hypothetical protein